MEAQAVCQRTRPRRLVSITVFSLGYAPDPRSGMLPYSASAAYDADCESFDAMFMAHTDLEPDHDHDSA